MLILNLLFAIFSLIYTALLIQYFYYWQITKLSIIDEQEMQLPISVIVAVRNEQQGIKQCIQSVLNQGYSAFEIIVVDDYSEDDTVEIVQSFHEENIRCFSLKDFFHGDRKHSMNKKLAIEIGVKHSKYDLIATIDGDCIASSSWMAHINKAFQNDAVHYTTGIVQYEQGNSLLHQFQEIDLITLMGITAASIQMKSAYMSNGANMAFRKKTFEAVGSYNDIAALPTGDDVFLMHKIIQKFGPSAVLFIKNLDASVTTKSCESLSAFLHQRMRWLSKSSSLLSKKVTATLVFMYLYHLMFLILFVACFFSNKSQWLILLSFYMLKISLDLLFLNSVSSYFKKRKLLFGLVFFEMLYLIYVLIIGILGLRGKYVWKNRSI